MAVLVDAGVRVVLDDFGAGYSSVATLSQLPLAGVKLDRSLIAAMPSGGRAVTTVAAVVDLAHVGNQPRRSTAHIRALHRVDRVDHRDLPLSHSHASILAQETRMMTTECTGLSERTQGEPPGHPSPPDPRDWGRAR